MGSNADDKTWLDQIRCPQYFDFEAALTVPCSKDVDTNPPLRDAIYESDDETRNFFRALDTDSSLHHTPHEQYTSPQWPELRKVRPVYRHRPSTSFAEYLQKVHESQLDNSSRSSEELNIQTFRSAPATPNHPHSKRMVTPKRNPARGASHTHSRKTSASDEGLMTPSLDSPSIPQSLTHDILTPPRIPFQKIKEKNRKSAPKDSVPVRRPRPPERVTPPLNFSLSKTTSGGFAFQKTRAVIARTNMRDSRQGPSSQRGPRQLSSEKSVAKQMNDHPSTRNRADLLDLDPDIVRMMEEHNKRVRRKQSRSNGESGKERYDSKDRIELKRSPRGQSNSRCRRLSGIRRSTRIGARDSDGGKPQPTVGQRVTLIEQQLSSGDGLQPYSPAELHNQRIWHCDGQGSGPGRMSNDENATGRDTGDQTHSICPWRIAPSCSQNPARESEFEKETEDTALDELLKNENERVLEERRKRLPERRRALQVDRHVSMRIFEGQQGEQEKQRLLAKVEFTSANDRQTGKNVLFDASKAQNVESGVRDRQTKATDKQKPRKRGLQGFRERSAGALSTSFSTSFSSAAPPQRSRRLHGYSNARRDQPYTDKVKAAERQKRIEKRLEEDLQSLLSQHNNRVQGNRRTLAAVER